MRALRMIVGRRLVLVAVVGFLAVALGAGTWIVVVRGDDAQSPAEATVQAFFEARRARDCERLVDLVAVSSWPGGSDLGRDGRVDECRAVVDPEQPVPDRIEMVAEDDDTATVQISVPVDDHDDREARVVQPGIVVTDYSEEEDDDSSGASTRAHAEGNLVREQGEWRVRLDHAFLHVGRSVEATVIGFVEAFRDGDCDVMADHLSSAAWSQDGGLSRDEYLDRCAASVAGRADATDVSADAVDQVELYSMQVAPNGDGHATATVGMFRMLPETLALRLEGGEWRLDAPLAHVGSVELLPFLADPVDGGAFSAGLPTFVSPTTGPELYSDIAEGGDAIERRHEHGFVRGVRTDYRGAESNSLDVLLFEFSSPEGALAYGELMASWAMQDVDPGSPVPQPSVADGRAAVLQCGGDSYDDCTLASHIAAFGVKGRFLVGVNHVDYDGTYDPVAAATARTEAILQAQLARLP